MMQEIKNQKGLGAYGWLFAIALGSFALMCGFKLIPLYMDNMIIVGSLKSLGDKPGLREMSRSDIRKQLNREFDLNGVRGEPVKSVKIDRIKDRLVVNMDYEVRVPLGANIDLVVWFKNQLDTANPAECCAELVPDEQQK